MSSNLKSSTAIPEIVTKPIAVTVPEAVRVSGIGRTALYALAKAKRIRLSKNGNRTLVLFADLERFIADGISAAAAAEPESLKKARALKQNGDSGAPAASEQQAPKRKRGRPRKTAAASEQQPPAE